MIRWGRLGSQPPKANWFCDFDDPTDDRVIKEIARKMIGQKVAIYIHTLDKRTPKLLATLAEKSGGKVVRKRI